MKWQQSSEKKQQHSNNCFHTTAKSFLGDFLANKWMSIVRMLLNHPLTKLDFSVFMSMQKNIYFKTVHVNVLTICNYGIFKIKIINFVVVF